MNLRNLLRVLLRRNRLESDMTEEMALHRELQMERNLAAGMSREEAQQAAERQFGRLDGVKEDARDAVGIRWLHDAVQDTRFALRSLRRNRGLVAAAISALAIGIGLNTAVFSIINTVFWQPIQGVPEPQRVLFFNGERLNLEQYAVLQEGLQEVATVAAARAVPGELKLNGLNFNRSAVAVTRNYFALLGVHPTLGRFFQRTGTASADDDASRLVAVLSYRFWQDQLDGDPAVIGQVVAVGKSILTVVGVAHPRFHGAGPEAPALWLPLDALDQSGGDSAAAEMSVGLIGRLLPGRTLDEARAAVPVIVRRSGDAFDAQSRLHLSVGREDWQGEVSPEKQIEFLLVTLVPLVVVGGVLWIACSNVANLMLARGVQRRREIAIRVASGAGRGRLIRMLLLESMLLALAGGVLGLWVSSATIDFVFATLSDFGALVVQIDGRVLAYTFGVSALSALLFGLLPALQASKADVSSGLKGSGPGVSDGRGRRLRAWFLASQIASSIALLLIAGTFVKSLVWTHVDAARNSMDRLLVARLPAGERPEAERAVFYEQVLEQLRLLPVVENLAIVDPDGSRMRRVNRVGDVRPDQETRFPVEAITPAVFSFPPLTMMRGRSMQESPEAAVPETVINASLARVWWDEDAAIGQVLEIEEQPHRVVGVVGDGRNQPQLYVAFRPAAARAVGYLILTRTRAEEAFGVVAEALRGASTVETGFQLETARKLTLRGLAQITQIAVLIGGLALMLAASGIYASMAFSTRQRTAEFGVRMALGAKPRDVLILVLRGGIKVVAWGSAVGVIVGVAGLKVLNSMLFGGGPIDWLALLFVLLCFGGVALAASLAPARQAARVDPIVALRAE